MKPICFIAARAGSRGVPNKNIKIISGKPLIAHTIEKAIKSKIFSHVIVSTDSKKIALSIKAFEENLNIEAIEQEQAQLENFKEEENEELPN